MLRKGPDTKMFALAAVAILLVLSIAGWLVYDHWWAGGGDDGTPDWKKIDRTMKFPRDEGKHDEPYESWTFAGSLRDYDGGRYTTFIRYAHNDRKDERIASLNALTDPYFISVINSTEGTLDAAEGMLDITFTDGVVSDVFRSTGDFKYLLDTDFGTNENGRFEASLNLTDEKKYPVLPFDDGTLLDYNRGTSYQYIQTRISVFGYYHFGNRSGFIEGTGYIYHMWGFITPYPEDTHTVQLKDGRDIWIYHQFAPDGSTYYNDVILVESEGNYTEWTNQMFRSSALRYTPMPIAGDTIGYVTSWSINASGGTNLLIDAISENQFVGRTSWGGICTVSGSVDGEPVEGKSISFTSKTFFAKPYIEDVSAAWKHEIDPLPLENFTVKARVYDNVPIDRVVLRYNVSYQEAPADPIYTEVEMHMGDDGYYYGHFPTPLLHYVVSYKVVAADTMGVMNDIPRQTVVIEFEY